MTFPTLVWLGLPSITANATSTVSIWPGSLGATWGFREEIRSADRRLFFLSAPSLIGGMAGAALLRLTPTPLFDRLVPVLILFATCLFMVQEPLQQRLGQDGRPKHHRNRWFIGALGFQLLVGVYGGYFGAGIGILMLAALAILGLTDIHEMNALKNVFALCINGVAALYFMAMGMVSWPDVLVMAAGSIAGGIGGAGAARRAGRRTVRWTIVGIGFAMALSLALRV